MIWNTLESIPRWETAVCAATFLLAAAVPSRAGDPAPYLARAGVDLAAEAALAWAPDAKLVYLENDEDVAPGGTALRWGYLFNSAVRGEARGYTLRDGEIVQAAELDFDFEAPPLPAAWVDSDVALAAAEEEAGRAYRADHDGRLATMLLIRGVFHEKDPDAATWTLVYTAPGEPALTVVVDAADGRVVRRWKG